MRTNAILKGVNIQVDVPTCIEIYKGFHCHRSAIVFYVLTPMQMTFNTQLNLRIFQEIPEQEQEVYRADHMQKYFNCELIQAIGWCRDFRGGTKVQTMGEDYAYLVGLRTDANRLFWDYAGLVNQWCQIPLQSQAYLPSC